MRNRADKKLQTDRRTDRWTDGPTDKLTLLYPPNRVLGCIIENKNSFWDGKKTFGKRRKCWLPAFSPFPSMFFIRLLSQGRFKAGLCTKPSRFIFTTQSRLLTILTKKAFENIVGKGENSGNQHFLLYPQCFLLITKTNFNF